MRGEDYIVPRYFSCVFEAMTPFKSLINSARDLSPFEWATLNDLWDYAKLNQPPTRDERRLYRVSERAGVPPAPVLALLYPFFFVKFLSNPVFFLSSFTLCSSGFSQMYFIFPPVQSCHCFLINVDYLCLNVGVCACGLRVCVCVCAHLDAQETACASARRDVFLFSSMWARMCVLCGINFRALIWLTSQKVTELSRRFIRSHSRALCRADRRIYTPTYITVYAPH